MSAIVYFKVGRVSFMFNNIIIALVVLHRDDSSNVGGRSHNISYIQICRTNIILGV